jgi:hypothetical protein
MPNKTFADLPVAEPLDVDVVPFQRTGDLQTSQTTWGDVFSLLLSAVNTVTAAPFTIEIDDPSHVGFIVQCAASQSAKALQVLDGSGGEQLGFTVADSKLTLGAAVAGWAGWVQSYFGEVHLGGGQSSEQYLEVTAVGLRVTSNVIENSHPGEDIRLRARDPKTNGLAGGNLFLSGANGGTGGSGNWPGGHSFVTGGIAGGSGVDGDVILLTDGTTPRGRLRLGNGLVSATGPVGNVVGKFPVYDAAGTFVGFLPLYDSIT